MKYSDIQPYIEKKLISEQVHPEDPDVRIFNYTKQCQFDGLWDDVTKQCRGLIMNVRTGRIIARPFPKFFNYQEHIAKEWGIPQGPHEIMEKMDGSLGILYMLNGKPWVATRGAFTSDQAQWATRWWREHVGSEPFPDDITNLFEIIYPENRIVINYDFQGLVYLASIGNKDGKQVKVDTETMFGVRLKEPIRYPSVDVETLAQINDPNGEGFVIYFPDENKRMKIKFPEYVRLHKLVTGVSEIAIWEHLRAGNGLGDLVEKVPDEFFKWVTEVETRLRKEMGELLKKAQYALIAVSEMPSRKEQAQWIMENAKEVSGPTFSLLDAKPDDAVDACWRMVRPNGQKIFKNDIDL